MERTAIEIINEAIAENPEIKDKPAMQKGVGILVTTAEAALDEQLAREAEGLDVTFPGLSLYDKVPILAAAPGQQLRAIIEACAEATPLPTRDILFFVLGYLRAGQEELQRRSGR